MNKCVNCGNDLIPGDKFCRRCGTPINNQNINNGMPNQMSNSNVHFTNNMNTQSNNTGYNNFNNNFNNNLNSNVNYNMNNRTQATPRKDNLSTLIIIIVALVIGVLFILFMPTIKKKTDNDTIIIKDNSTDNKKDDNNSSINTGKDNNSGNKNNGNNSGNNNSGNNSNQKSTITFYETTFNKRSDYSYKFSTSGTENYLVVQNKNGDDEVIIQGIYKASISDINKNSSIIKSKYTQAGYQTGASKYTTYKGKKLYTLEISRRFNNGGNIVTYKMLVGFYEIENGIVASIQLGDMGYTRYNYSGYEFLTNIFNGAKVSSAIKNGASYEVKANISEIINKFLTKE